MLAQNLLHDSSTNQWIDLINVVPASGVVINLQSDGTYLYAIMRDVDVSTTYLDTIRTYTAAADGSLTQVSSIGLSNAGGVAPEFNTYFGGLLSGAKYYASFGGGLKTFDVSSGVLTEVKTTFWRPAGDHAVVTGALLHGKYWCCGHGNATAATANFGYWVCDGINDHSGPTISPTIPSRFHFPMKFGADNIYTPNLTGGGGVGNAIQHIRVNAAGAISLINTHSMPSTLLWHIFQVEDRLYYSSNGLNNTVDGYFPINPDGTLGGRVVRSTIIDRPKALPIGFNTYIVHAGYAYRCSMDFKTIQRRAW